MLEQLVILLPEIFIAVAAIVALLVGMFSKPENQFKNSYVICLTALVCSAGLFINVGNTGQTSFSMYNSGTLFFFTDLQMIFKSLMALFGAVILGLSKPYLENRQNAKFEFNVLFLMAMLGAFIAISTTNFIILFIGLELMSFSLYILVGFNRASRSATISANKYFIMGCVASGFMLYGISLLYVANMNVSMDFMFMNHSFEVYLGLALIFAAVLFKLAVVPFHFYLADVFFAANRPMIAFLTVISKFVGFSILLSILMIAYSHLENTNSQIAIVVVSLGLLNILIGSVCALKEDNINKFIAYSGIANVGFMLISAAFLDIETLILYLFNYSFIMLGFITFLLTYKVRGEYIREFKDISLIAQKNRKFALLGVFLAFALSGIPPFALFYAKFSVIMSLVDKNLIVASVIAVLLTVLSAAYCLRVVKFIYFDKNEEDISIQSISSMKVLTYVLVLIVVILSLSPVLFSF